MAVVTPAFFTPISENMWDELARRTFMSRQYARECAYVILYRGSIDPWLDAIVRRELEEICRRDECGVGCVRSKGA